MKIVFMGTGEFAVPSLEAVHAAGHIVSLVVSQPDRPQGRGLTLRPTPIKAVAERLGLPVFQPEKLRLESDRVIAEQADILVVVAYGQILRENVLQCATRGAINVHASLLPKYRGAAPIQWAMANGETVTGVTTMQLDRGMDTGPMLLQRECAIAPEDTTATLEPKLAAIGATLLLETLTGLEAGILIAQAQDHSQATMAPLIKKTDGLVEFTRGASDIANRLRGFSPWPGVQFVHEGRTIKILTASPGPDSTSSGPGQILAISREGVDVACGEGSILRVARVQPESRGPVSGFDFANGSKLRVGMILGGSAAPGPTAVPNAAKD
ncbi:MAG: methionyl-tRNA formyltransferase [Vicinamibacteria bacterium]